MILMKNSFMTSGYQTTNSQLTESRLKMTINDNN